MRDDITNLIRAVSIRAKVSGRQQAITSDICGVEITVTARLIPCIYRPAIYIKLNGRRVSKESLESLTGRISAQKLLALVVTATDREAARRQIQAAYGDALVSIELD